MTPEGPTTQMDEATARREFLRQVGKTAAAAPAIALLLAVSSKPASANGNEYGGMTQIDPPSLTLWTKKQRAANS